MFDQKLQPLNNRETVGVFCRGEDLRGIRIYEHSVADSCGMAGILPEIFALNCRRLQAKIMEEQLKQVVLPRKGKLSQLAQAAEQTELFL